MKKSDLKTGMRVKTRDYCVYLVVCDVLIHGKKDILFTDKNGDWLQGYLFDDNLMCETGDNEIDRSFDIMEVYTIDNTPDAFQGNFMNLDRKYSIWKRQEYTDQQKEIFKALKTLGYNYIARDQDYTIYAYELKPEKSKYNWYSNDAICIELETNKILNAPHLNFINWEDEEPFEIPEV